MASVSHFYQVLVRIVGAFILSLSSYLPHRLTFIRLNKDADSIKKDCVEDVPGKNNQEEENQIQGEPESEPGSEPEKDIVEFLGSVNYENEEESESSKFSFTFRFPRLEEFRESNGENIELLDRISKYESVSGESPLRFVKEPEILSFDVNGGIVVEKIASSHGYEIADNEAPSREEICQESLVVAAKEEGGLSVQPGALKIEEETENLYSSTIDDEETRRTETIDFSEEKPQFSRKIDSDDEVQFQLEKDSSVTESDSVSIGFEHMRSLMNRLIDSYSDEFMTDEDIGGDSELDPLKDFDGTEMEMFDEVSSLEELGELDDFEDEDRDIMDELWGLEEDNLQNSETFNSHFLPEEEFHREEGEKCDEDVKMKDSSIDTTMTNQGYSSESTSEDANKLESLWEHQELIDQLKMELRKVRATGLPTILEDSESPKVMDDLKPWKIDERFQHGDCMGELHKFYRSYRERMRKFDILNYQKMYAIGFLKLKDPESDPLRSIPSGQKSSGPTLKSLFSSINLSMFKNNKTHASDPMIKFTKELQGDLEVVYVGQMCLSWEFLHWQYGKALELWDSDPRRIRRYNEVAGEFQQFQVLMQRFIEDEPFQGPRLQNYIKNRCVFRNLLQIPVIREDSLKDKKKGRNREKGEYVITSDMLVEIVEESIRIFWRFVRADKDCSSNALLKNQKNTMRDQIQNPGDLDLLMEVRTSLQKKERKLKEMLRTENCILRKFRRCREEETDHVLYFFSQVDMKLVGRVLSMSRISHDQLVWCHNKLSKINFASRRKIHVEPSFLLFPC